VHFAHDTSEDESLRLQFLTFLLLTTTFSFFLFIIPCRPGVPFETEASLRDRGTSKTPDVLLKSPVGILVPSKKKKSDGSSPTKEQQEKEWKVINWIDSKVRCRFFGCVSQNSRRRYFSY